MTALIGVPGRRFTWAGGFGAPTVFNVNGNSQSVAIALGFPSEVEPNDDIAHANMLTSDSYVVGNDHDARRSRHVQRDDPDARDLHDRDVGARGNVRTGESSSTRSCPSHHRPAWWSGATTISRQLRVACAREFRPRCAGHLLHHRHRLERIRLRQRTAATGSNPCRDA